MNKNNFLGLSITFLCVLFLSCSNSNKFKIAKGTVGELNLETQIKELDLIFKKDSLVKNLSEGAQGDNYFQDDDKYLVYEKGGKLLLTITPKEQLDSISTIKSVQIHDARYATESGINLNSSFSEINASNNINRVERTFSSATLFIDDFNATITIDNDELGIKGLNTQKVTLAQIPDLAKMKSFTVWFH